MQTISIKNTEAVVGDIVHIHGARFEVIAQWNVEDHPHYSENLPIVANKCKWLSGKVEPHYFGPDVDWLLQGNKRCFIQIEPRA